MTSYGLLPQAEEDVIHKSRLLSVEEKPFKRITKRLLAPNSLTASSPGHLPTPPPETVETHNKNSTDTETEKQTEKQAFREDVLLDFAAFESTIVRIQFLLSSNEKERQRYANEKIKIEETAQAVRDNSLELKEQLENAQSTLALRKTWDELADKITNNRALRTREEQHANLEKLNSEIADLERESSDYKIIWTQRRKQFGRIVEEGIQLRRLIRDEKEEAERKEGMMGDIDMEDGEASSHRGRLSTTGTPRPDTGGTTPMHLSHDTTEAASTRLTVESRHHSTRHSPALSRAVTPHEAKKASEELEDNSMMEEGEMRPETEVGRPSTANTSSDTMMVEESEAKETPRQHGLSASNSKDEMDTS